MNWYDLIDGDDNRLPNCFMATEKELFGRDSYDIKVGMPVTDWNPDTRLWSGEKKWDGMPDDILANALGWPIFSQRLRDALAQKGIGTNDVQYLPIRVARSTGKEITGFAVANIVTRVPALDPLHCFMLSVDQNEIDPLTGKPNVTGIGKIALKSEPLHGHDAIRLLEFFPPILVSEQFVKVFNGNGFTGATFTQVSVM